MSTIAVIIARGGSRRLPRKNVQPFCGIPLVAVSIIQARCSALIDETIVSTDDQEIADISERYGARVLRRPDWPDANEVAANRVFLNVIDQLEPEYGLDYTMLTILPTSPLKYASDYDRIVSAFHEQGVHVMYLMARKRETFIYKDVHPMVKRFVFGDKTRGYFAEVGGFTCTTPRWYRAFVGQMDTDLDKELDAKFQNPGQDYAQADFPCVEGQLFQEHEVDTAEEFELAEQLMEHYILKGRGMQVYYDYAAEHGKTELAVESAVNQKYGNWRQQ